MIDFTDLEMAELGEAFAAHDEQSARDIYHVAAERREIEELRRQGRLVAS